MQHSIIQRSFHIKEKMSAEDKNIFNFNNKLVWAKMRFCPYWPGRVVEPPKELGCAPKNKACVFFFGSKNFGFILKQHIFNYEENKTKYSNKCKKKGFIDAVTKIEEYISDPEQFASNVCVGSDRDEIVVKKEHNPVVKSEKNFEEMPYETEVIPRFGSNCHIAALIKEKEAVIKDLLVAKTESQQTHLQLQLKQKLVLDLKRKISESEQRHIVEIKSLTEELQNMKKVEESKQKEILDLNQLVSENEKKHTEEKQRLIAELNNMKQRTENKEVQSTENYKMIHNVRKRHQEIAEEKQDQANITKRARKSYEIKMPNKRSCDEYEVEIILSHKILKNHREFYVRWKHFSSDHDSWVKEKNLNCPLILKSYLKNKHLHQ